MGLRFELDELPPRWREQAERQMRHSPALPACAEEVRLPAAERKKAEMPQSERDYYNGVILPGLARGEIVRVLPRERFLLLPAREYGGLRLPAAHYTPDFILELPGGAVEVVEVKSKFTRAAQRDYIYRRRLFIDLVAEPRGWRFTEYIADKEAKR